MNRTMRLALSCGIGVLVTGLTVQVGAAVAQESPFADPVNLKVLPKDIGEEDLRGTMVGFSAALNAKCSHCHAGDADGPVRELDFPSDNKRAKRVAREMLRMVTDINQRVSSLELEEGRQAVEVACMTCHRGQNRPRLIQPVLTEARQAGGAEAVIGKYSESWSSPIGSFRARSE
jgi:cytochrome c2